MSPDDNNPFLNITPIRYMADNLILPFIKSDILVSDIGDLNDAGILKVIFKNLMKAEIFKNIYLNEEDQLKAFKSLSTKLELSEDNMKILEIKEGINKII